VWRSRSGVFSPGKGGGRALVDTRRSPVKTVLFLRRVGLNLLLDVFVHSLVTRYNCLCVAQVLLEFFFVRGLIVILVKFEFSHM
jgi:hypothetical protein